MLDELTREFRLLEVKRSGHSVYVIEILDKLVAQFGAPDFIRSDNAPEVVAHAVKYWIVETRFKALFIEPVFR